jgi:hypothetical protein
VERYEIRQRDDGTHYLEADDAGEHEGLDDALYEVRHAAPGQDEFEVIEPDGYISIWT